MTKPIIHNDLGQNSLEQGSGGCKTYRKPKHKAPVTIVTALVCKTSIILASDSRTTNEDGTVRDNTQKITIIKLSDGFEALVGQSGNADLGSRAVEIMADMAKSKTVTSYRTIADLAEEAVGMLKLQIRKQFQGSAEELQKHFENHNFDLMIVYYHAASDADPIVPYIFTLHFSLGAATRKRAQYFSIGVGSPIADFLLDGFDVSKMNFSAAFATAIYVIDQVKQFDPRCGGKTTVAQTEFHRLKHRDNKTILQTEMVPDSIVQGFLGAVKDFEVEVKHQQHLTGFTFLCQSMS